MKSNKIKVIYPDWPAPAHVHALCTTRLGGLSQEPYAGLNLADHVGDDPKIVAENRLLLRQQLNLPQDPLWMQQAHRTNVICADTTSTLTQADAAFACSVNNICVVLTADCLPILLCDRAGTHVAAIHAGWRGLAAGITEQTIRALHLPGNELLAWLGPAIGPDVYEVGDEVRDLFIKVTPEATLAFKPNHSKWHANLYLLAKQRLQRCGVTAIYGGEYCTYSDPGQFYSFRRDGQTGRMASLIYFQTT